MARPVASGRRLFAVPMAAVFAAIVDLLVSHVVAQDLTEFPLPTPHAEPTAIVWAPDGALWFTEKAANKIGRITVDGTVTEFPVPTALCAPHGITLGADGNVWFTEAGANKLGRITPSGTIAEFPLPSFPHVPLDIASGPDGNLWISMNGQYFQKVSTSGSSFGWFLAPVVGGRVNGLTAGPDGNVWFTASQIVGRITPTGVIVTPVAPLTGNPSGIALGPDGNLWVVTLQGGIVRVSPSGASTVMSPGPGSKDAAGIAVGPDGTVWFPEQASAANQIARVSSAGARTEFPIPTASAFTPPPPPPPFPAITENYNQGISLGSDGNIWFTEKNAGKIGRLRTAPVTTPGPSSMNLNGGRFRAEVNFVANGTPGTGTAVPLTSDTGYFWFFSRNNVELTIKVVDGRAVNGRFWVFYGALTDVAYTLRITDTVTGALKQYQGVAGHQAGSNDVEAFP